MNAPAQTRRAVDARPLDKINVADFRLARG